MAQTTVYAFRGHEPDHTAVSKVKATREKIQALGYEVVEGTAQVIDDLALNDEEFYEPDGESTSQ
jgi:hypothetical protein